jgi:large subunit ribosomal protein L15
MNLNDVNTGIFTVRKKKRVGRGIGSGTGKTGGRGMKGQYASAGAKLPRFHFEGGQMPLFRRMPKRGFSHGSWDKHYLVVNVGEFDAHFEEGAIIDIDTLKKAGLCNGPSDGIRVLGDGEVTKKYTVNVHHVSKSAKEKIEAKGGSVEVIPPAKKPVRNKMKPKKTKTTTKAQG